MSKLDKIAWFSDRLDPEIILDALGIEITGHNGANLQAHCPLPENHDNGDATPSWGFHTEKLVYNCFACGGGTVVDLVQNVLGLDEDSAIEWLRQHSDLEPADKVSFKQEIEKILREETSVAEILPAYDPEFAMKYKDTVPYFLRRGISEDVCDKMDLGQDLDHIAVVIPHWFGGNLVGVQRRHLYMRIGRFFCPLCGYAGKYKNTPNFPKSLTLYNFDNLDANKPVVVVESPMTALYLMSNGYENVAATFGSFGAAQMALLVGFKEVWVWPDNDKAGLKNLQNSLLILEKNVSTYIIPAVPGENSDGANVAPEDLNSYMDARYPSTLFGLDGLRIGV